MCWTFTAASGAGWCDPPELGQLSDGADLLLVLAGAMLELQGKLHTVHQLRDFVSGQWKPPQPSMPLHACTDARSVYSGIAASVVKMPVERRTLYHAQWIRELLNQHVLDGLWWIDTRDCCADGMTKGACDRGPILKVMHGIWRLEHEALCWSAPSGSNSAAAPAATTEC